MSKSLLFITSRLLWPIDGGRKMSLNYYCKGLHDKFGYDIYLYCFLEKGQIYDGNHPDYIKEVYIAEPISRYEIVKNLIRKTLFQDRWPIQCSLYYSKKNKASLETICDTVKPEVVITEMIRTATYITAFGNRGIKTISNLDDLLSKRYIRQMNSDQSKANFAGAYSEKLPSIINRIILNDRIKKYALRFEADRCAKWEKMFYQMYDYVMFTSPIETREMNKMMCCDKAITLSVGIDYELFSRKPYDLLKEKNSLSYVGNFKVSANKDTLKMICEEILPLIKHDYKLYIIGICPREIINKYQSPKVIFTGRVDDLVDYVKRTEIFLSPISYGTGIKTKIIEAMAMGVPVITNDVGAEGILVENEIIIKNKYKDIAMAVDFLLDNEKERIRMSSAAQYFVYKNFRWDVVYKAFEEAEL